MPYSPKFYKYKAIILIPRQRNTKQRHTHSISFFNLYSCFCVQDNFEEKLKMFTCFCSQILFISCLTINQSINVYLFQQPKLIFQGIKALKQPHYSILEHIYTFISWSMSQKHGGEGRGDWWKQRNWGEQNCRNMQKSIYIDGQFR